MKENFEKTYTVFVKHLNQYSRKFIVTAKSEYYAKQFVREMISNLPLDQRSGTFDGTRLTLSVNKLPDFEAELLWLTETEEYVAASTDEVQALLTPRILQIATGSVARELRRNLDVSQRQFAIHAGLRQPTVGVLERGETGVRLYNFLRISHALGKNPDDLLRIVMEECERLASESSE